MPPARSAASPAARARSSSTFRLCQLSAGCKVKRRVRRDRTVHDSSVPHVEEDRRLDSAIHSTMCDLSEATPLHSSVRIPEVFSNCWEQAALILMLKKSSPFAQMSRAGVHPPFFRRDSPTNRRHRLLLRSALQLGVAHDGESSGEKSNRGDNTTSGSSCKLIRKRQLAVQEPDRAGDEDPATLSVPVQQPMSECSDVVAHAERSA